MATLVGWVCTAPIVACSSNKNVEARQEYADSLDDDDRENCVNPYTCTPDPGPKEQSAADCARMTEGLEFLTIWDYDGLVQPETGESYVGAAFTFGYDDKTTYNRWPAGWQPPTEEVVRCGEVTHAYHTWGGPFIAWGGGFGGRMDYVYANNCPSDLDVCTDTYYPVLNEDGFDEYTDPGIHPLDLRKWEGISFWARRAPDSQSGIRVWLADTNVDEDVAFALHTADPGGPRPCERVKECGCRNHTPCLKYEGERLPVRNEQHEPGAPQMAPADRDLYFCYDPETDAEPVAFGADWKYIATVDENGQEERHDWCGPDVCNFVSEYSQFPDIEFEDKPCTDYTLRTGLKDAYCFDPETDPPPAPTDQQCGDGWIKAVTLSTDWQFFKIPFTELLQQGWAKEFHELNLEEVSAIRFTYNRGYIDYWIDDVAFYREATDEDEANDEGDDD